MPETKTKRGCWTCKNRKIRCDLGRPVCETCVLAKRKCLGYGLRLSWPGENDRRRAMTQSPPLSQRSRLPLPTAVTGFLNTTFWDLTLHHEVVNSGELQHHIGSWSQTRMVARPLSTIWSTLGDEDQKLLSYYETTASRMITTIDDEANGFRHVLISMAFSGSSDSSSAIIQAILAFSACQLYGGDAASVHNAAAVQALSKSMETSSAPQDRLCQLAASMLLVTFGVFHFNKSAVSHLAFSD
ncbi:MAG: hypothetical protein HETSPECPRED_010509 [Heterodermia speciosa]|uniref:Zn(2)-C6 fungal-type domain-containing protein n=1 Tax=Heterodermia speciosa TaxID=116794 RepID=A0A8H3G9A5_9LECA|nr:MAG: hypothetical protein HETSPECPRED_010509 [Heterodermia speciosa]